MKKDSGVINTDFSKAEVEQVSDPAAIRMAVAAVIGVILAFTADIWYPLLTNGVHWLFGN